MEFILVVDWNERSVTDIFVSDVVGEMLDKLDSLLGSLPVGAVTCGSWRNSSGSFTESRYDSAESSVSVISGRLNKNEDTDSKRILGV